MPPATLFRYIAHRTLIAIIALLAIFICLIMTVDLIENLRFAGKVQGGDFNLALSLTLLRMPSLVMALTPFIFLFGAMWMFHQLNKRSEISVMRSAGLSVWRLLGPAALIAAVTGLASITLFDPISANLMAKAESLHIQRAGDDTNLVRIFGDGIWLRQRTSKEQLIINAQSFDNNRTALNDVTIWRFNRANAFLERIDAESAILSGATLELHNVVMRTPYSKKEERAPVYAVQTPLTVENLRERAPQPQSMSIWQLPKFMILAETAGLPTTRYNIRFHELCATPLNLLAMVLIAAAFSMRPTRTGRAGELIVLSILTGFALYIAGEISAALGESGLAPEALAAWAPAIVASIAAVTVLLHVEDG